MRSLLLVTVLISASAVACPELAGSYHCTSTTGNSSDSDLIIEQSVTDNVAVYKISTQSSGSDKPRIDTYFADSQPHSRVDQNTPFGEVKTTFQFGCGDDLLAGVITGESQTGPFAEVGLAYFKTEAGVRHEMTGHVMGMPVEDTFECSK